jgi:spore coat protein U-like protein
MKACVVTAGAASNIQIGPASGVASSAVNTSGSNNIAISCTKNVPYYIGLAPSNGNTAGAGVMSGTGSNADKVPYQLHSVSAAGPIWGNTATSRTVGNGVQGTGTGAAQSIPVFATAPSANFTPDTYSDTVTVRVNY